MTKREEDRPRNPNLWKERIVKTPDSLGGKPRVKGTRISVELVTDLIAGGSTDSEIMRMHPSITPEDIEACIRYKASGAKLTGRYTWTDLNARMDEADAEAERQELARLRKLVSEAGDRPQYWKTRIVKNPRILSGKPIIKGTRISVELITDLIAGRRTTEDIIRSYPSITLEDIEACIQYKASGKKLSPTTWTDVDRMMDEADVETELREIARLRKMVGAWTIQIRHRHTA